MPSRCSKDSLYTSIQQKARRRSWCPACWEPSVRRRSTSSSSGRTSPQRCTEERDGTFLGLRLHRPMSRCAEDHEASCIWCWDWSPSEGQERRNISRVSMLVLGQPCLVWRWVQIKDGEVQKPAHQQGACVHVVILFLTCETEVFLLLADYLSACLCRSPHVSVAVHGCRRLRAQICLLGRGGPGQEDVRASPWDVRASACHSAGLPAGFPSDRSASRARLGWQQRCCISYRQILAAITCSLLEVVSLFWLRVNSISGMEACWQAPFVFLRLLDHKGRINQMSSKSCVSCSYPALSLESSKENFAAWLRVHVC